MHTLVQFFILEGLADAFLYPQLFAVFEQLFVRKCCQNHDSRLYFRERFNHFKYGLGSFEASHYWHGHVHEDKFKGSVGTATGLVKPRLEHVDCNVAIKSLNDTHAELIIDHKSYCHHVEEDVVHNKDTW